MRLKSERTQWSSHGGAGETNPTSIHEDTGSSVTVSCGVGCRHEFGPGVAVAVLQAGSYSSEQLLAWELPYAASVGLKSKKQRIKTERKERTHQRFQEVGSMLCQWGRRQTVSR